MSTYDVHVRFIGKRVVNFPLAVIELFSLGVTAEELRAKINKKIGGWVSIRQIFALKGTSPLIIFAQIVRPMNALQLCR